MKHQYEFDSHAVTKIHVADTLALKLAAGGLSSDEGTRGSTPLRVLNNNNEKNNYNSSNASVELGSFRSI